MQNAKLEEAIGSLPFSLIEINKPGDLEGKLPQILHAVGTAADGEVSEAGFNILVRICDSWGFQSVLHGNENAVIATLSKRLRETGATRVGCGRSRPFGDVAVEKMQLARVGNLCQFLLADSSGGPVFAFAIAPRAFTSPGAVSEWWLAGNGLTHLLASSPPKGPAAPLDRKEQRGDATSAPAATPPRRPSGITWPAIGLALGIVAVIASLYWKVMFPETTSVSTEVIPGLGTATKFERNSQTPRFIALGASLAWTAWLGCMILKRHRDDRATDTKSAA